MDFFVKSENKGQVTYITFFHPAGNSFPSIQLKQLVEVLQNADNNTNTNVIVLESIGKTFCAGASFEELLAIENIAQGKQFFSGFANVLNAMRKCKKLIVGKAQGKAVGGGVGILSACDYVIASPFADIKLSELAIGIGPFVIEPAVTLKLGLSNSSFLTFNATAWQTADWALNKGLYSKIIPIDNLDAEVEIFANQLASYNPNALLEIKKAYWNNTDNWETLLYDRAEISGSLVLSDFTKKALASYRK